jgi:two-component system sensor histidine kinase CpxA
MPFVRGLTRSISQLNSAAGSIARGNFNDRVSEKRRDELGELSSSVNTMAEKLGHFVSEQRRITADVAHELCSPIARMQMALGVVEQRSTPEQANYLKKLDAELQHMAKLVEEVLAFSKAETVPKQTAPEKVPLTDLVAQVVSREGAGSDIEIDVPAGLHLQTRREALDRALGNVLRNAVRYAAQGGPIRIQARTDDHGGVVIAVSDQGPGVPPEALPKLFDAFYRPDLARSRDTGGAGLGLAIVKSCIETCKGTVTARNREPHGLIVEFRLLQASETTPPKTKESDD